MQVRDSRNATRLILLDHGKCVLVDACDYEWLSRWNWFRNTFDYVYRNSTRPNGEPCIVFMHAEILNTPKGMVTDHINGNPLDNRRCNLRLASHSENMRNRKLRKDSCSGFKGVFWVPSNRNWRAQIQCDGKKHHLGIFGDPISAAKAYNEAALRIHGRFARLNVIPDVTTVGWLQIVRPGAEQST